MTDGFDFPAELRRRQRHQEIGIAKAHSQHVLEYEIPKYDGDKVPSIGLAFPTEELREKPSVPAK
jgi:hypothetical protein